jgi:hypothetical protein
MECNTAATMSKLGRAVWPVWSIWRRQADVRLGKLLAAAIHRRYGEGHIHLAWATATLKLSRRWSGDVACGKALRSSLCRNQAGEHWSLTSS